MKKVNIPKAKDVCTSTYGVRPCGYCDKCRQNMKDYSKQYPIKERMADALRHKGFRGLHYQSLMSLVFPDEYCPSAYNRPTRGGPYGCAFALGKAIRMYGYKWNYEGYDRYVYMSSDHPDRTKAQAENSN